MSFFDKCKIRQQEVEGVGNWLWPATDDGAWDGPVNDWVTSHKFKFMKYVKKRDVVFTAGGNCGLYTRLYADLFGAVYTFEPDPLNFYCLVSNNQLDKVVKIQAAVGEENKMITVMHHSQENVGMHTVEARETSIVPMLRIDNFKPKALDLLQLDIEGYEKEAVMGAMRNIEKFKPVVVCERGNDTILSLLSPLGYRVADQSVSDTVYVAD